jgi:hypothetical protein
MPLRYLTKKKKREQVERTDAAVRAIYAAALPERQEYPPVTRAESKNVKPAPVHEPSRIARLTKIPPGGLHDGTKVVMLDGVTYTSVRGGLVRARQTTLKKRAA